MQYSDIAGHNLTYILVIAGIFYIIGLTAVILRKSWKRALKIGYTQEQLWKIVKISASYALIPTIAVLVGFLTLAPILGIPLSWWRLSVIGNTAYELMATSTALTSAGVTEVSDASGDAFILVMYVIAVGVMGGMVIAPLLAKSIQQGTLKVHSKDRRWGALRSNTYMATILIVFIVPVLFHVSAALLTLITGGACMAMCRWCIRRLSFVWLSDFALTLSMLVAMASSVLWQHLLA
jgi:hypothetical protein